MAFYGIEGLQYNNNSPMIQAHSELGSFSSSLAINQICWGDGKAAWEAIVQRVAYVGVCFTEDHAA